jgi:hypothetical protein
MKLWIDDVRPAPQDGSWWIHLKSVNEAKEYIELAGRYLYGITIELIDIDHDAGDFVNDGGDYIRLLDWLEEMGYNYPIRIHSMNPVGRANMEAICRKNNWKILR